MLKTPTGGVFDAAVKAVAPAEQRACLTILNDGSMLPGLHGWHEAKVGAIVRNGDAADARYVAVWGEQDEFHEAMCAALDAERWQSWQCIVWIADGARGNWTLAETVCPTAIQILDFMHAVQNGVACGKSLLGDDDPLLDVWRRSVTRLLSAGAVDTLISELMNCTLEATDAQLDAIAKLISYYRANQSRMNYPWYRANGYPIGSGIVESAHRHVLQRRMKLSGQHWSRHHGRRMVLLRAAYRTAGPARMHTAINRAYAMTHIKPRPANVALRAA